MKKALLALLFSTAICFGQSPYNQSIYPAQSFTATAQTGAVIALNGATGSSGSSFGAGTITVAATSLTTATFAVQGSSDGGLTYFALPITPVAVGASQGATVTATAAGLYQVSLVGITHVKFVTSGTFTASGLTLTLTATPQVTVSRSGSGGGAASGGVALLPGTPNVVYSFVASSDQAGTTVHDISGSSNNASISQAVTGATSYWTGTGLTFGAQVTGTAAFLPLGLLSDQSYCISVYIPYYGTAGSSSVNAVSLLGQNASPLGWNVTANFVYGAGVYQDVINGGGGSLTQAQLPQETGFHTKCLVMATGQNDHLYVDGVEIAYQSQTGNRTWTTNAMALGFPSTVNSTAVFYYFAGWQAALSAAQIQQASFAMTAAVATRGVPVVPPSIWSTKSVIHTQGDSITCCSGAITTQWYPTLLSVNSGYSSVVNEGEPGFPVMSFAEAARWRDTPACNSGGQPSLITIFGGTNDGLFGATAQVTFNAIQSDVNVLKSAGCQVGVATMLSRTALDTFKDQLNPLIRAGAANGGYFLIDTASSPNLGCDGCNTNTTYFNTDDTHPTNAGQTILGAEFSNAINAYGIGAASSSNPTPYVNTATLLSSDRFVNAVPTAATTYTMPDCLGVTGAQYQINNFSAGANTITFTGKASEAITGSTTLAQNGVAIFRATLISQAAAGCGWLRVQ